MGGASDRHQLRWMDGTGWAFSRCYTSGTQRRTALRARLHQSNHHRPHSAIGKVTPITRLTNVPGQYP